MPTLLDESQILGIGTSTGSKYYSIDYDNDSGVERFYWQHDAEPGAGTDLMSLGEDKTLLFYGNDFSLQFTGGNTCYINGAGQLQFIVDSNNDNTDSGFHFASNGLDGASTIMMSLVDHGALYFYDASFSIQFDTVGAPGFINSRDNLSFAIDSDGDAPGATGFGWFTGGLDGAGTNLMWLQYDSVNGAPELGLGVADPGYAIDIDTGSVAAGINLANSVSALHFTSDDPLSSIFTVGAQSLSLGTLSGISVLMDTSSNVAIPNGGLIVGGLPAPLMPIQLYDYGGLDGNANQMLIRNNAYYSAGLKRINDGYVTEIHMNNLDGTIQFRNAAYDVADSAVSENNIVYINTAGIGVYTDPDTELHLRTNSGPIIKIERAGFTPYGKVQADGTGLRLGVAGATGPTIILSNDVETFRFTDTGDFGVACTPNARLEVEDGGTTHSVLFKVTQDDNAPFAAVFGNDSYSTNDEEGIRFFVGATGAMYIDAAGTSAELNLRTGTSASPVVALNIDTSQNIYIPNGSLGVGTNSPDGNLHVHNGSAGSVTSAAGSVITVENNTNEYLSFLTPSTSTSVGLLWGDEADNDVGYLVYNHTSDAMLLGTGASTRAYLNSSGLGIGTTPSTIGHFKGSTPDLRVENTTASESVSLSLIKTATKGWSMGNKDTGSSNDFVINDDTALGGTDRIIVKNSTGYVGLGTGGGVDSNLHVESSAGPIIKVERTGFSSYCKMEADGTNARIGVAGAAGSTIILDNDSEAMRLNSSGISFDSGSNYFGDYTEGNWTPVVSDASTGGNTASITTNHATYQERGNRCDVEAEIVAIDTTGMTGANQVFIQSLPFPAAHSSGRVPVHVVVDAISFSGYVAGTIPAGASYLELVDDASGSLNALLVSALTSTSASLKISFTYKV